MKDLLDGLQVLPGEGYLFQHHFPFFLLDAAPESVDEGPGLLKDLLLHEMLVPGLFRHGRTPGDGVLRPMPLLAVAVRDLEAAVLDQHQVVVLQKDHPAGVGEDGRDVRGQEKFPVAQPQDQGALLAGRHQKSAAPWH